MDIILMDIHFKIKIKLTGPNHSVMETASVTTALRSAIVWMGSGRVTIS